MDPARDRYDAPGGGNVPNRESHEAHVPAACEGRRPRRSSPLEERLAWVVEKYLVLGFALPGGPLEEPTGAGLARPTVTWRRPSRTQGARCPTGWWTRSALLLSARGRG